MLLAYPQTYDNNLICYFVLKLDVLIYYTTHVIVITRPPMSNFFHSLDASWSNWMRHWREPCWWMLAPSPMMMPLPSCSPWGVLPEAQVGASTIHIYDVMATFFYQSRASDHKYRTYLNLHCLPTLGSLSVILKTSVEFVVHPLYSTPPMRHHISIAIHVHHGVIFVYQFALVKFTFDPLTIGATLFDWRRSSKNHTSTHLLWSSIWGLSSHSYCLSSSRLQRR